MAAQLPFPFRHPLTSDLCRDALEDLQPLMKEALEMKQDNDRRKRRRETLRISLLRILELMAVHRVFAHRWACVPFFSAHFGVILPISAQFGVVLAILAHFEAILTILAHFRAILAILAHFRAILAILAHFRAILTISAQFGVILTISAHSE